MSAEKIYKNKSEETFARIVQERYRKGICNNTCVSFNFGKHQKTYLSFGTDLNGNTDQNVQLE